MVIIKLALSHRDCAEITSLSGDTIIPMWMKGVFFVLQRQFDSVKAAQEIEQGIFSQAYIAIFGEYTTQSLLLPLLNELHRLFQGSCDILSFGQFEQPGIAVPFLAKRWHSALYTYLVQYGALGVKVFLISRSAFLKIS